jgi:hypothetical protein
MRLFATASLLALVCAAPALELPAAPADQRWQVAVDLRAVLDGRLGKWVHRICDRDPLQARLQVFTGLTGIDALKDLDAVELGGADAEVGTVVATALGRVDAEKFSTFLRSLPEHQSEDHRGHTMHSWWLDNVAGGSRLAATAGAKAIIGAGSVARADAAIDAFDGAAPAVDTGIFPKVELPKGAKLLLAISAANIGDWQGLPPEAGPARAIKSASLGLGEKDGVLVLAGRVVALDAQGGEKIASIIDGGISAASLDNRTRTDAALTALVDSFKVVRHGTTIDVTAELPIDLAEKTWDPKLDVAMRGK